MGSYAVGSGGGYSNYSYQLPQSGSQASGLPNQGDGSLQESKSLLSNTDPHANDLPILGAKDNRVISNKTIQKHLDDAMPKKRNIFQKIGDFFKGVFTGIKNLFKALLDPKNWPLIIGAIALTILFPPAGMVLAGIGLAMGGSKMIQGASSGDWEKVGEGTLEAGLSAVGFKGATSGVKTGGTKYTLSGTRTAEAEANVAKAQEALTSAERSGNSVEIAKATTTLTDAEKALGAAKSSQAQASVSRMNFISRNRYLDKNNFKGMSQAELSDMGVAAKMNTEKATTALRASEDALQGALKSTDEAAIASAKTGVTQAQQSLLEAKQAEMTVLKAARIKQLQEMGYVDRTKASFTDGWATTKDSLSTVGNKQLTSMDGRTLSYWSRTPKNQNVGANPETLDTAEQGGTMSSKFRHWFSQKWGSGSNAQAAEGTTSTGASSSGSLIPKGGMPPMDAYSNNNSGTQKAATASARVQQWWADRQLQNMLQDGMDNKGNIAINSTVPTSEFANRKSDNGSSDSGMQQFRFETPA